MFIFRKHLLRRLCHPCRHLSSLDIESQMLLKNHATILEVRKDSADTSHDTKHGTLNNLTYGSSSICGLRKTMEDVSIFNCNLTSKYGIFGVFDGHSGSNAVNYISENIEQELKTNLKQMNSDNNNNDAKEAIIKTFEKLDQHLTTVNEQSGTCGVVALVERDSNTNHPTSVLIANLGDSRAVLGEQSAFQNLSIDHAPSNPTERERIIKAGGTVENVAYTLPNGSSSATDRINGKLAVSRSFGDSTYKQNLSLSPNEQLVSAVPELRHHIINAENDQFLLLACDGVWDVMSSKHAVDFVRKELKLANKQCLRVLGENFGSLRIEVVTTRDVSKYNTLKPGTFVDFPKSRDKIKGYLMKTEADDGSNTGVGRLFVRQTPPEAWEGSWEGIKEKDSVARAWPCGIVCENLIDKCLELGSTDNISAMVVLLTKDGVGMAGHDGSGLDDYKNVQVNQMTNKQKDAWQRRRNNTTKKRS